MVDNATRKQTERGSWMMCVVLSHPYRFLVTIVVLLSVRSSTVRKPDSVVVAVARMLSLRADSNSLASFAEFLFIRLSALSDRSSVELSMW